MNIKRPALQMALLVFGFAMIAIGLARGESVEVFNKAIVVCMDCIGLGG